MIDRATARHAALSKNSSEHLEDLGPAHGAAFHQTDRHPHIVDQSPKQHLGQGLGALRSAVRELGALGQSLCLRRWVFLHRGPWRNSARIVLSRSSGSALFILALVLTPFVLLPVVSTVIIGTAPDRLLTAMGLSAAKGAAQIATSDIAGMAQEKNAAMPTATQALSQERLGS